MLNLVIAAAVAAQPAGPAPASPQMQHDMHMPMDQSAEHKDMDCCPCCKDMSKHEGHQPERGTK
jgi:hypothetical protein